MVYRYFEKGRGPANLMYQAIRMDLPDAPKNVALYSSLALVGASADAEAINLKAGSKSTIYIMVVGPAGSGKSSTITHAAGRLVSMGVPIGRTHRPSREGLARELVEYGTVVHVADEVHEILRAKRSGEYLSGVVELWKMAYDRQPIRFSRIRHEKMIEVPPSSRLVVFATTTPEDFDDVRNAIDPAILRRFIVLTTKGLINMFKESRNPIETLRIWRTVAAELMFLRRFEWKLWICSNEKFFDLARIVSILTTGSVSGDIVAHVQQQTIRLAMILALNDVVETALVGAEEEFKIDAMDSDPESLASKMESWIDGFVPKLERITSDGLRNLCRETDIDPALRIRDTVMHTVVSFIKGEIDLETAADELGKIMEIESAPTIIGRDDGAVYVSVPSMYLAKGFVLALLPFMESMGLRTSMQLDPLLSRIIRAACQLREQGKPIKMREISRKLGKRYNALKDAVKTLIVGGILVITKCDETVAPTDIDELNDRALTRCIFEVDPSVCS